MIFNKELCVKWFVRGVGAPRAPNIRFPRTNYIEHLSILDLAREGGREFVSMSVKWLPKHRGCTMIFNKELYVKSFNVSIGAPGVPDLYSMQICMLNDLILELEFRGVADA